MIDAYLEDVYILIGKGRALAVYNIVI